jgi:lipoprotein-anchoring transpeptidase ErfK/SrfK
MRLLTVALLFVSMSTLAAATRQSSGPFRPMATPTPTVPPGPPRIPRAIPVTPTPTPKVPIALPIYDEETSTRLQIFLDNSDFGPGKIDGKIGEFFGKALQHYKRAHGMPETGAVDSWLLDQVPQTFTTYTIREEDSKQVGELPAEHAEQAKLKWQPYTSMLEFVAERYHSAEDYVRKLNPGKKLDDLKPGDVVTVPNVLPFELEKFTEGKMPKNPAFAARKILVDTREHFLEIFDGNRLVAEFPITPGSTTLPAPIGTWKIVGVAVWPWFRYDEGMLNYGQRTDTFYNLPPGPNNLVGVLWAGLNRKGIGIHGTNNPETIGRAASHGCIRLANWDAARVKDLISEGNVVEIK